MTQAEFILLVIRLWAIAGLIVAVPFLTFGIDRIDEDAQGAYVFRPLLLPGVVLIWPLVLWRWYVLASGREIWARRHRPPRESHKWFALVLPVAIVLIIGAGLSVRQVWPAHIAPEQLTPPAGADQ